MGSLTRKAASNPSGTQASLRGRTRNPRLLVLKVLLKLGSLSNLTLKCKHPGPTTKWGSCLLY